MTGRTGRDCGVRHNDVTLPESRGIASRSVRGIFAFRVGETGQKKTGSCPNNIVGITVPHSRSDNPVTRQCMGNQFVRSPSGVVPCRAVPVRAGRDGQAAATGPTPRLPSGPSPSPGSPARLRSWTRSSTRRNAASSRSSHRWTRPGTPARARRRCGRGGAGGGAPTTRTRRRHGKRALSATVPQSATVPPPRGTQHRAWHRNPRQPRTGTRTPGRARARPGVRPGPPPPTPAGIRRVAGPGGYFQAAAAAARAAGTSTSTLEEPGMAASAAPRAVRPASTDSRVASGP